MKRGTTALVLWATIAAVIAACPGTAVALPPAPANDAPGNAEVIGPAVPIFIEGTTVLAVDDINTSTIPALAGVIDGPDVFYSFTPASTDTYRIHLWPWHRAPLRSSDFRFAAYVQDSTDAFVGGVRASSAGVPLILDVALTASETYRIGIDHDASTSGIDNFVFTMVVSTISAADPDMCEDDVLLSTTLPVVVVEMLDGSTADYAFSASGGQCAVASSTTAPGGDHVYRFRPDVAGKYAIELVSTFDGVIYVDDSCPPFFPDGCLGASNHGGSGAGRHELIVVDLLADTDYWVFVDSGSGTTGSYTLIIDDAFAYEINETEPNDSAATATPLDTPLNGGQIVGPGDVDYWEIANVTRGAGPTGDRIYAWVNNGGALNSTLDTDLDFVAADGTTVIEHDDEDGDGATAPIMDLRFIYSTTAPVIAGAQMTSSAPHYLRVNAVSATGTVHRYRLHVGVESADRAPFAEVEPNNSIALADRNAKNYFAGVVPAAGDIDFYAYEATVGDRVFIALDGDPERDSDGTVAAGTDPKAFNAKLVIYDPAGDVLIDDISDTNSISDGIDYPAQAGFFVARSTGTHYVSVEAQSSSGTGPEETYELAIFLNDAAPALADVLDPELALTPDFVNNEVDVTATDNQAGDSGICDVDIIANDNLQLTGLVFNPGDGTVTFTVALVNGAANGSGKLIVTDCAGNTAAEFVIIDVETPVCGGANSANRNIRATHGVLLVPDNNLAGIMAPLDIDDAGIITDVNVTVSVEATDTGDIDLFLISPTNTVIELVTDRMSSLAVDMTDATFDDSAATIMPILSSQAPFTGSWLPEDPLGMAKVNGEDAQGTWMLNVVDDESTESGGMRLRRWSLDITATFPGPEFFTGVLSDNTGIASIVLSGDTNVVLTVNPNFTPGDTSTTYTLSLIDPQLNGSGTITVTDVQDNQCQSVISLDGFPDMTAPDNSGSVTTDHVYNQEAQLVLPGADLNGVTSTITVSDSFLVSEVEVDVHFDAEDIGREVMKLTNSGNFASLLNRIGMDERGSVGLTKAHCNVLFDDDAPQADDAHLEPALGSIAFAGPHQPDGRGEFFGDGINSDDRDNMLFVVAGGDAAGNWDLNAADVRIQGVGPDNILRRWSLILKSPCGPERYTGTTRDLAPGTGICSIDLAGGATNLMVVASFTAGDDEVSYAVELVDPSQPGSGTLEIADCEGNVTMVPISLAAGGSDNNLPVITGAVDQGLLQYEGTATDNQAGDTGIVAVDLAPFSDNLQIVSVTPAPPAASVDVVVGLINPAAGGRGYVRVTDDCGHRAYALVEIDPAGPQCTGTIGHTKRYRSTTLPQAIPDNNVAGVSADIVVTDVDIISDVDVTLNITHPFAADMDVFLTSPLLLEMFTDIGNTGNDFIDTTLDDEAAVQIPNAAASAPWTGSWQPEGGPRLFNLDGVPAAGTYTMRVADDAVFNVGTFDSWSLLIESATFPNRYDGRAEDSGLYSSGICSIVLLGGSHNVALTVDPFAAGDHIVRYSVALIDPDLNGSGVVRVTDCAGNTCEASINLIGALTGNCTCGDLNGDGLVELNDFSSFAACFGLSAPDANCPAQDFVCSDLDANGAISLDDFAVFAVQFGGTGAGTPPTCP